MPHFALSSSYIYVIKLREKENMLLLEAHSFSNMTFFALVLPLNRLIYCGIISCNKTFGTLLLAFNAI